MSWSFPSKTVRGYTAVPATKSRACGAVHKRPRGYPQNPPGNNFPLWRREKPLEVKHPSTGRKKCPAGAFSLVSITPTGIAYPNSFWRAAYPCSLDGRAPLWRRVIPLEETKSYLAGGILGVAKWSGVDRTWQNRRHMPPGQHLGTCGTSPSISRYKTYS